MHATLAEFLAMRTKGREIRREREGGMESTKGKKGSPYSITERRVPELIPVLGSQPAGDVSHKPDDGCHYFPPGPQLPP